MYFLQFIESGLVNVIQLFISLFYNRSVTIVTDAEHPNMFAPASIKASAL